MNLGGPGRPATAVWGSKMCPKATSEPLAEQISRDVASKLTLKFSFGVGGSGRRPRESADPERGPACGVSKRGVTRRRVLVLEGSF